MRYLHNAGPASAGIAFGSSHHCAALVVGILFTVLGRVEAATVTAASLSFADVTAAIALAANRDIVVIPAGTATWTNNLTITKAITLQGAGVGLTIIKDNVQSGKLIQWTLAAGLPSRLTGIEFQDGGRTSVAVAPGGILHVDGSNTNGSSFRWDHCKWNNLNGTPVLDTVIGVIDHSTFVLDRFPIAFYVYGTNWDGHSYGDGSWAASTGFGSSQFLFIEDNTFTHSQTHEQCATDGFAGARFVVRHNSIFNCFVANHGTESSGRERGSRALEVYNNTYTGTDLNKFVGGVRSGGVLFHDNTISGYWTTPTFGLSTFRTFYPFPPWGGADGTNAWDVNHTGGTAGVFFTGTAASNSSGTTVTVSGSPGWSTNQWAGYTVRRTTNLRSLTTVTFSWILSSTSNTITYTDNGAFSTPSLAFTSGDTVEIRKVDHELDQLGRALGSLISGDTPSPPSGWNDQVTEPCYSWNNGQASFSGGPGVRANVHYFNNTPMPGYTPYTYPHPLATGGAIAAPPAPGNLRVISGP